MRLKDIKEIYHVSDYKRVDTYSLHKKEIDGKSRMVHKYYCELNYDSKKAVAWIGDSKPTKDINELKNQVESYVKSLPYDSEYYYPHWRKGMFEELVIHDYLKKLGFEFLDSSLGGDSWRFNGENCYGKSLTNVHITIRGIGHTYDMKTLETTLEKEVSISLYLSDYSWVSSTCKREVEEIKKALDSLLKPLMISESVGLFSVGDLMKNMDGDVELNMEKLFGVNLESKDFKGELKKNLLAMADKL